MPGNTEIPLFSLIADARYHASIHHIILKRLPQVGNNTTPLQDSTEFVFNRYFDMRAMLFNFDLICSLFGTAYSLKVT